MAESVLQPAEAHTSPAAGQHAQGQTTHRPMISVELVIQCLSVGAGSEGGQETSIGEGVCAAGMPEKPPPAAHHELWRSVHRIPAGTTIRQLLQLAYPDRQTGSVETGEAVHGMDPAMADRLIADIDTKARGLSRHGRRAWLDDVLVEADRVEVMLPILIDARKARFERVAKNRARKWRMSQSA
ncbi:MAG: hypothetical protein Q4B17_12470 [Lautropia sp.]|nr:hypothetical protein [Lautropia sp.]